LQMNMINVPARPFSSDSDLFFPETVSGRVKSGAVEPNGTITEGVAAMAIVRYSRHD
jgi:hypothetical protein